MQKFFKSLFEKTSGKDVEKKIDIFISIMERNKIKNSGASIDDVVAFSRKHNIQHDLYV